MDHDEQYALALRDIRSGNLDGAEAGLRELLRSGATPGDVRQLERVASMKVLHLAASGQLEDAHRLAIHYLVRFPHSSLLTGAFESLQSEGPPIAGSASRGRLVLGAGTGRSGSTSLTLLLQAQDGGYFSHEHPPRLNWQNPDGRFAFHMRRFRMLTRSHRFAGDVSHWWLPRVDAIIGNFPDAKIIVTRRDRDETIASFLRMKGGEGRGAINHWVEHDGSYWQKNIWDETYPKFKAATLRDAIAAYWTAYYDLAGQFEKRYPANVRVVPVESLSSDSGQRDILGFAGFTSPRTVAPLRSNVNSVADGEKLIPALF